MAYNLHINSLPLLYVHNTEKYLNDVDVYIIMAYTEIKDNLTLTGVVITPDGKKKIEVTNEGPPEEAEKIGTNAAETLLKNGADLILEDK